MYFLSPHKRLSFVSCCQHFLTVFMKLYLLQYIYNISRYINHTPIEKMKNCHFCDIMGHNLFFKPLFEIFSSHLISCFTLTYKGIHVIICRLFVFSVMRK